MFRCRILFFVIQYSLIVSIEEEFLTSRFGDAYRDYLKSVRRFVPSPARLQQNVLTWHLL